MDWDDVRFFLAVARRRTLSAAARDLAVTQPTVGRRIAAFERHLETLLFVRRSGGFELTAAGAHMLGHAERMEHDAIAATTIAGRDVGVRGVVRVTASEWLVTSVIAPMLGTLLARYPALEVELVAEQRHVNLARREADIALRPRRFEQQAVVQRATVPIELALYATPRYLATRGTPRAGDGSGHTLIAMLESVGDVARDWLATTFPAATRTVRTNGRDAMVALASADIGIACLARVVGDRVGALQRLAIANPAPAPMLWMGMARDASKTPRVRAMASFLTEGLRANRELNPG